MKIRLSYPKVDRLSRGEEKALVQRARNGDGLAKTALFRSIVGIVIREGIERAKCDFHLSVDIVATYILYIWEYGFRHLEVRPGNRASAYLLARMRSEMRRIGLLYKGSVMVNSRHLAECIVTIRRIKYDYEHCLGRAPSIGEIAQAMSRPKKGFFVSEESVRAYLAISRWDVSRDDEDATIPDAIIPDTVDRLIEEASRDFLYQTMKSALGEREQDVVTLLYGFGGRDCESMAQIGRMMGVCRNRIRQLRTRALKKLSRSPKFMRAASIYLTV